MSEKKTIELWAMTKAWDIAHGETHNHIFSRDHFIAEIIQWLVKQHAMVIISRCRVGIEVLCTYNRAPSIRAQHDTLVGALCDAVMARKDELTDDLQAASTA